MSTTSQPLEPRRHFTFTAADASFGVGGVASTGAFDTLVPIADGRLLAVSGTRVRYLHGDGNLDAKRGTFGKGLTKLATSAAAAVAVDAANGRVAVLRDDDATFATITLETFDSGGRSVARRTLAAGDLGGTLAGKIAIDRDGAVTLATTRYAGGTFVVELRRFDAALAPAASFGTAGVASRVVAGATNADYDDAAVSGVSLDAGGRAYVAVRVQDEDVNGEGTVGVRLYRFGVDGTADVAYGGASGYAAVFGYDTHVSDVSSIVELLDLAVAADGRAYAVTETDGTSDYSPVRITFAALRIGADGATPSSLALGRSTSDPDAAIDRPRASRPPPTARSTPP